MAEEVKVEELKIREAPPFITPPQEPLQMQVDSMREIHPENLTELDRELVFSLAQGEEFAADKIPPLDRLLFLLHNADLVDIITRVQKGIDSSAIKEDVQHWQEKHIARWQRGETSLPETIMNDDDFNAFLIKISPTRIGQESLIRELTLAWQIHPEAGLFSYAMMRPRLTEITKSASYALTQAADLAIASSTTSQEKRKTTEAIMAAIRTQDKWWVLGGNHSIDSLTKKLLKLLPSVASKEDIPMIMEALFNKVKKESPVIAYAFGTVFQQGSLDAINPYIDACLTIDKKATQATQKALLHYYPCPNAAHRIILDLAFALPQMEVGRLPISSSGELTYYDQTFAIDTSNLPQKGRLYAFELVPGVLGIKDEQGNLHGIITAALLESTPPHKLRIHPPEELPLSLRREEAGKGKEGEAAMKRVFLEDFESFSQRLTQALERRINRSTLPLPAMYQLWKFLKTNQGALEKEVFTFLSEYGPRGLVTFLTSEYGQENIPLLLTFGLEAQEPRERVEDEGRFIYLRARESFTEHLFGEYTFLTQFTDEIVAGITADPARAQEIRERILLRAKAMLVAAAKIHQKKGGLTQEEQAYINLSFDFYHAYLRGLSHPESDEAYQLGIPFELLQRFFRYHDLSDPDIAALYKSAEDHWFDFWAERQKKYAPYTDKVDEINKAFYMEYAEVERDSAKKTADPEMEIARDISFYDHTRAAGLFPDNASVRTDCPGSGHRVDSHLIKHLKDHKFPVQFPVVGIDFLAHPSPPEDLKIIEANLLEELRKAEHQDRYNIVWRIWPGYPTDAILLDLFEEDLRLNAPTIKAGGFYVVDVPFPYGEHSYAQMTAESDKAHLEKALKEGSPVYEPPGQILYREFEREGKPAVGKGFLIINPEVFISKAAQHGLTVINVPKRGEERERFYRMVEHDDSILANRPNVFKHPVWQTKSGWNRITFVFYKGELPKETKAKLPKVSYENKKA